MNDVLRLARPDILELQPYQHAAWNPTLERLHANEMPWRATGDVSDAGLNRYPEPQPRALLERLARLYDVPVEPDPRRPRQRRGDRPAGARLLPRRAGPGRHLSADLRLLLGCRAHPGRGGARGAVACGGLRARRLRRSSRRDSDAKLVFLCSPNNPTGQLLDEASILELCRVLAAKALIVVDEAYIEFSMRASLASRLAEFPNLVVLRTLSKAYALAGARCGALLASEAIVGLLRRILPPYALPASSVEAVLRLTAEPQRRQAQARIDTLRGERERMRARLVALPGVRRVLPSDANFLLAEFAAPQAALAAGCAAGLLIRDLSANPRLPGCLRLTVGTPEQNERLLAALEGA